MKNYWLARCKCSLRKLLRIRVFNELGHLFCVILNLPETRNASGSTIESNCKEKTFILMMISYEIPLKYYLGKKNFRMNKFAWFTRKKCKILGVNKHSSILAVIYKPTRLKSIDQTDNRIYNRNDIVKKTLTPTTSWEWF